MHKDFLSAVFDIGLKNCTIKSVKNTINPQYDSQVGVKQLQQYLNELKKHRDEGRASNLSCYEESMKQQTGSEEQTEEKTESLILGAELAGNLIKKLDYINEKITNQTNSYATLKASLSKQQKVQYQLMNKIAQLDPKYNNLQTKVPLQAISSSDKSSPLTVPPLMPTITASHSSRAELQIMSDMRAQMDVHRRLLSRRQDHLSQSSIDANSADALAPRHPKPSHIESTPSNTVPTNEEGGTVSNGDQIIDEWFGYDSLDMDIFSFLK